MTKKKTRTFSPRIKLHLADDGTVMDEEDFELYKKVTKVSNKPTSHKEWLKGYWKWRKQQDENR